MIVKTDPNGFFLILIGQNIKHEIEIVIKNNESLAENQ